MSKEQYYDEFIAPRLIELSEECEAHGLSFLAVCEWTPGEYCQTMNLESGSGFGIRMTDAAVRAKGNIDSFMFAIMRHARKNGHSSMILKQLGVPINPVECATNTGEAE